MVLCLASAWGWNTHGAVARQVIQSQEKDSLLFVGEELEYKVSYSIFTLGRIRVRVFEKTGDSSRSVYKAQAHIDSAPGLPFVNLHILFESSFDEDVYSYSWVSRDSSKSETAFLAYLFDYVRNVVLIEKSLQKVGSERIIEKVDTVQLKEKAQDGLSLFFFARKNLHLTAELNTSTVIGNAAVNTYFNYPHQKTSVDIDAVDYPVDVIEFNGRADYSGVFGMNGAFRGWFSNDTARVPVVARMKVLLGSIYIELVKWNRKDWQPPKFEKAK
jgi:hypothetical protein